jgi:hypothetical protein
MADEPEHETSFAFYERMPSAILSDGLVPVPLWAVTAISLSQSYHLPPIGSSAARAMVDVHSDTIVLNGVLIGHERFAWKLALETIAESGRRGGSGLTAGLSMLGLDISGLILVTAMTIRTDMQVQAMSFSASATRREALDVSITLVHMPPPGAMAKLLDIASVGLQAVRSAV